MKFIINNTTFPDSVLKDAITTTAIVSFWIEKDGNLTEIKIEKSVNDYLDREAVRVVKSMTKWTPGKQRGKPVKVKMVIPIRFELD